MAEWLSAEDVTGTAVTPSGPLDRLRNWTVPKDVQASRDLERRRILTSEAADPRHDAATRAGVSRELARAGGPVTDTNQWLSTAEVNSSDQWLSPEEITGAVAPATFFGFLKDPQAQKQVGREYTSLGDLILGMPAFIAQVGATGAANLANLARGSKTPLADSNEQMASIMATPWMKFLLTPLQSGLNISEEDAANTTVGKVLGGIAGAIDRAAEYWSEKTGAKETGEALKQATQIAIAKGGATFVKGFKEWAAKKKVLPSEAPKAAESSVNPAKETVDAYTDEVLRGKARTATEAKAAEAPAAEAPPTVETPAAKSNPLDPYVVPAAAGLTGAAAWALQDKLDDTQLATLGLAGAAGIMKLHGVPEGRLVEMLKQGGQIREAAAAQIYRDNVPMLARALRKYEKQGVQIEDVVQRTMEKGLRAIEKGQFSGDSAIQTYLYRIAENEARSGLRYEKVRPQTESLDLTEQPGVGKGDEARPSPHENIADASVTGLSPERVAINNALGEKMSAALDKLPENFRRPFEMRELQGMEYAEIAQELGIPLNTVRTQILRAKEKLQQSLKEYAPNQRGSASVSDIATLAGITAGGSLGAVMSEDSPLQGALYGALAGGVMASAAGRRMVKQAIRAPDEFLGLISTRLGNIAPELKGRVRDHERRVLKALDTTHDQVTPFLEALQKQPKGVQELISRDLLNGETTALKAVPELAKTYPRVQGTLRNIEAQLKSLGRFAEGVGEYFPRIVKDYDGLKNELGKLDPSLAKGLEKALVDASAKMMRQEQRPLTEVEQSVVTNRYLRAQATDSDLPGYAHGRRIREVTERLQPFYEAPTESLLRYISGAVTDIEAARFFGRDIKVNSKGEKKFTNVDDSIGNLTARLLEEGRINSKQAAEVRDILRARFVEGEQSMNKGAAFVRDVTNTALLGNVMSAATQLGDSAMTIYHYGLGPTLAGLTQKLRGQSVVTSKDLGLVNHVAEELAGKSFASNMLQKSLKYSGFAAIDQFAKGLSINAALQKYKNQAQTPAGQMKLAEKYGYAFEGEMPQLIADLQAGRNTLLTQQLAFEALSDIQPISRAELPQAYLEHPNGRLLYQLKTYMLKQGDIVRRDAYENITSGKPAKMMEGWKNLATLASIYAIAGVPGDIVKAWISGDEVDPLSTPKLVDNVLKTFGLGRYNIEKLKSGKVVETGVGLVTPPLKVLEDIAAGRDKAISYLPLIGRPIYDRLLDGNEKREISEKRSANKGLPKGEGQQLSDAAKEYLQKKRDERKEKRDGQ